MIYKLIITKLQNYFFMFIKNYRYQLAPRKSVILDLPLSSSRIQNVNKRISTVQLKGHQNKHKSSDSRKLLIESTQKAISQKNRILKKPSFSMKNCQEKDKSTITYVQNSPKKKYDLSKRQDRIIAARKYGEKIWKTSDISSLLRAQQQMISSRRTDNPEHKSCEKVFRHQNLLKQFGGQSSSAEKQKLKRQWFAFTIKSKISQQITNFNSSVQSCQLQISTIDFEQSNRTGRNQMKLLINRERRKEMIRRTIHITNQSLSKRPNTTGNTILLQKQDNFLEPW